VKRFGSGHNLIKVLSYHLPDRSEENRVSQQPVSMPRFKLCTSHVQIYSITIIPSCSDYGFL